MTKTFYDTRRPLMILINPDQKEDVPIEKLVDTVLSEGANFKPNLDGKIPDGSVVLHRGSEPGALDEITRQILSSKNKDEQGNPFYSLEDLKALLLTDGKSSITIARLIQEEIDSRSSTPEPTDSPIQITSGISREEQKKKHYRRNHHEREGLGGSLTSERSSLYYPRSRQSIL
jgi:hypothetical protein